VWLSPVLSSERFEQAMSNREAITDSLALILEGIRRLGAAFPHRALTIDGRLVGDIGEVIAAPRSVS
jgi:hypothetical protein